MPVESEAADQGASKVDNLEAADHDETRRAIAEPSAADGPKSGAEEAPDRRPQRDSKRAAKGTTSIDVEIFGTVYHVRGEQDPDYLKKLAEVVDSKMRAISHHVPVVDSGKIAILAALNLADELLQCNRQQEKERTEMMEKVEELTGALTAALDV